MNTQQKCPHCITPAFTWHAIYYAIAWLLSQFIQHCFTCLLLINQMFTIARLLTGKVQICKLAVSEVRLQILISNSNAQSSTPLIYTHNSKNILQKCWYQSTLWLLLWCMLWNKTLLSRLFCPNSFTSYSSSQWSLKSLISSTSSCTGTLKFTNQTIRCFCITTPDCGHWGLLLTRHRGDERGKSLKTFFTEDNRLFVHPAGPAYLL